MFCNFVFLVIRGGKDEIQNIPCIGLIVLEIFTLRIERNFFKDSNKHNFFHIDVC